ncbi:hypothetical protein [Ralstonia phage RP13]|nr:hypothetical protein [Ralstonia phage RP13]
MNHIVRRIVESMTPPQISEADWSDVTSLFDEKVLAYWDANTKNATPEQRQRFKLAIQRFSKMAREVKDPLQALYYEYRALGLPENQAVMAARSFYRREIKNGVISDTISDIETGETRSLAETVETADYGHAGVDKGIFTSLTSLQSEPQRLYEVDDFFTKLFASPLLDQTDRIVLVTYLTLGTGPGFRAKAGGSGEGHKRGAGAAGKLEGNAPIDLEMIMDKPPKELDMVKQQIKDLIKFGVPEDEITGNKIFHGATKGDQEDSAVQMRGLIGGGTKRVVTSQGHIQNALKALIGKESLADIKDFLLKESHTPTIDTLFSINEYFIEEASDEKSEKIANTIDAYLTHGRGITIKDLIPAIISAVSINIKNKTRLSKSKAFNGSVKSISRHYVDRAKTGKLVDIYAVQDLFLAPVLDKQFPGIRN